MSNDQDCVEEEGACRVANVEASVTASGLPIGPIPGVEYPVIVIYCGNCGLPVEVW